MLRFSQFFKKIIPWGKKELPQEAPPKKLEIEKMPKDRFKHLRPARRKSIRSRISNIRRAWKRATVKDPYTKSTVSFGTFQRMKLLPGQKTGMTKFLEREKENQ